MKRILVITDSISAIILLLLFYTAISKLADHDRFEEALRMSPLLNEYSGFIAWILPAVEITVALLLFLPSTRLKGFFASFVLITIFTIYLGYMVTFAPHLPCNCGGVLKSLTWVQHIVFNLFFIFLSLTGVYLYRKYKIVLSTSPP